MLAVAVGLAVVSAAWVLIRYPGGQGDFAVYRAGARIVLDGGELYRNPVWSDLRFTYPPFAAVLLAPFALLSYATGSWLFTALSVVALGLALAVVFAVLNPPGHRLAWVGAALPLVLLLEPVRSTFGYGQINLLLMALVAVDCLVRRPRWPRGALVGIAAAIKLTPLAFVLFFLLNRDRRAALTSLATFACGALVGWLATPANSLDYWTSAIFDTRRIGALDYVGNESLRGVLAKAGILSPAMQVSVWAVGCLAVVAGTAVGMRRALLRNRTGAALVLNALAALLVSPISWSHHWVWLVPAVLVYADLGVRTRRWTCGCLAGAGVLVMFVSSLDGVGGTVLGAGGYFWFALAVLIITAFPILERAEQPRGDRQRDGEDAYPVLISSAVQCSRELRRDGKRAGVGGRGRGADG
ncbi:alpha-1,2-mannosyltransferase [Goodfellowiella coeruleoviolacea]|uniref:Alpha-1,2-mannosyltransferase n=1 Tax=Goodfellowiella coeruleoviolacea TaxID=334858 RepID=A0AAE3KIV9_9PSEU|nr:alpha-1,2-mannosyltransferase [Goodfellowiella coeruleoviolacea]